MNMKNSSCLTGIYCFLSAILFQAQALHPKCILEIAE